METPFPLAIGDVEISTLPIEPGITVRSATNTPSGKVLLSYADDANRSDPRYLKLAVMDDDGRHMQPIFSQRVPERAKDNGIRFMVFPYNKRVFLGDFIVECAPSLDA